MSDHFRIDQVRVRREALHHAIVGLEDALASPLGETHLWRERVSGAVDDAAERIAKHIEQTEALDGLLQQIVDECPRLNNRVRQMKIDHEHIQSCVSSLKARLERLSDDEVPDQAIEIRNMAVEFLGQLARHRQRGADLIYEAYNVDIGSSA